MGKGRAPCCDKSQVKRGPWSPAEDLRLITFIQKHGRDNWRALPKQAGLLRCGKSCRLRWMNYLRPDVKRGNVTKQEEEAIIKLHQTLGNKWSKIASCFPGRTDNEIKNIWNTRLKKRLPLKGCDSGGDESTESTITSSSLSSIFGSIPSCGRRGLNKTELRPDQTDEESFLARRPFNNNDQLTIQEKLDQDNHVHNAQKDQLITTTSSVFSNDSNMLNTTTTQIGVSRDYREEEFYQMDNLMFDFEGPYDDVISDILQEVDKPVMMEDHKLLDGQTLGPLESDYDFWNTLDSLGTAFLQSNDQLVQVPAQNSETTRHNANFGEEHKTFEIENRDWFRFLEAELGLEENDNQNQRVVLDQDQGHATETFFHCDVEEKAPEELCDPCQASFH